MQKKQGRPNITEGGLMQGEPATMLYSMANGNATRLINIELFLRYAWQKASQRVKKKRKEKMKRG
jgi:hypothetical protein